MANDPLHHREQQLAQMSGTTALIIWSLIVYVIGCITGGLVIHLFHNLRLP